MRGTEDVSEREWVDDVGEGTRGFTAIRAHAPDVASRTVLWEAVIEGVDDFFDDVVMREAIWVG